ncbi:MAG: endolytic transglycosylase MltG, partial [Myxococcota bacterium]
ARGRARMIRLLLVLFAVFLLLLAGTATVVNERLAPLADGEAPESLFVVEPGDPLARVASRLEDAGLVRDARAVSWLARWRGVAGDVHVGEYALRPSMAPGEILDVLVEGRVATWPVSIPEGFTAALIAERLAEAGVADADAFLRATEDASLARDLGLPADRLEGYLFPETYRLPKGLSARQVATLLVEQFLEVWQELAPKARARGLSMHEVVTLASIVEKETGAAHERPRIASVFANRVARRMRLESDPTTIYGIPDFDGNLRRVHLDDAGNPYNTYQIPGLPPGPIASPGRAALRAVVEPEETDYLYFVSKNDGTHVFSRTYREHVNAVNEYQRRRSRR